MNRLYSVIAVCVTTSIKLVSVVTSALSTISDPSSDCILFIVLTISPQLTGMNIILISFSNEALNVFGVYFKLQSFVFMPVFGLNNGIIPIISYNYGAGYKDRVKHAVRLGIITATAYMLLGLLVFQIFPNVLLGFFNASEYMVEIGNTALRIISTSFIFAGVAVISSAVCQALGKSIYSLIVSVGRQLVVLIPVAFLLSLAGNLKLVWVAFPIAEVVSFTLSVFFLVRSIEKAFGKHHREVN